MCGDLDSPPCALICCPAIYGAAHRRQARGSRAHGPLGDRTAHTARLRDCAPHRRAVRRRASVSRRILVPDAVPHGAARVDRRQVDRTGRPEAAALLSAHNRRSQDSRGAAQHVARAVERSSASGRPRAWPMTGSWISDPACGSTSRASGWPTRPRSSRSWRSISRMSIRKQPTPGSITRRRWPGPSTRCRPRLESSIGPSSRPGMRRPHGSSSAFGTRSTNPAPLQRVCRS